MPPKRPGGRPPAAASAASSSAATAAASGARKVLHTQELILFTSPISAIPAPPQQRTRSTNKRSSSSSTGTHATAAAHASSGVGAPRSTSQRRTAAAASSAASSSPSVTAGRPGRASAEFEVLPVNYRAAPCPPSSNGARVPSPPPPLPLPAGKSLSSSPTTPAVVGGGSRVVRLLRDARAAVRDPIRPDTPLDSDLAAPAAAATAFSSSAAQAGAGAPVSAGNHAAGLGHAGTSFLPRRPGALESRTQRRLPAGGRLAPMAAPSTSSSAADVSASPTAGDAHASGIAMPAGGLSSSVDTAAASASSLARTSPLPKPLPAKPAGARSGEQERPGRSVESASLSAVRGPGIDTEEFARLYPPVQQAGEPAVARAVDLLLQLKHWQTSLQQHGSTAVALNATTVTCLQTTLMHLCQYWPTGAALQQSVQLYTARAAPVAGSPDAATPPPLLYAQGAMLAATLLLQTYTAAALLAEPVSMEALLRAVHTIAESGLAAWVAQEAAAVRVLVELLPLLTAQDLRANTQALQWLLWIVEVVALCCEEAAAVGALGSASGSPAGAAALRRTSNSVSGVSLQGSLGAAGGTEADLIRGRALAAEEAEHQLGSTQRHTEGPGLKATAHQCAPAQRPGSTSTSEVAAAAGSPLSFIRSGGSAAPSFNASLNPTQPRPQRAPGTLERFGPHLASLGLLAALQQLDECVMPLTAPARSLEPVQPSPAAGIAAALIPALCAIYRFFAEDHAAELRQRGVVQSLVGMLNNCATNAAAVEAAARALVKLTYDDGCLAEMQADTAVLAAAGRALRMQLVCTREDVALRPSIELLVARLCGAVARVAEGSTEQQDFLASSVMSQLLQGLVERYVTEPTASPHTPLPPTPVLQAVVWVLGMASMSPRCPLPLVRAVTPSLVRLLEVLHETANMQLTAVYVLMCLSNLSYFFGSLAVAAGASDDGLPSLYGSLGLLLARFLFEDNVEATVEVTRVLGNMSYTNAGRDWMEANRCDEVVVLFLGHEDLRIVYNCCGVLLNLTAASPCRVVEEPELLQMMLSYTARYTGHDKVQAAAALQEARLRERQQGHGDEGTAAAAAAAAEAGSQAAQIADLVEKLLLNVRGLMSLAAAESAGDAHDAAIQPL